MTKNSERDIILNSQYHLISKIGQGSFGTVYMAKDLLTPGKLVAVKVEPAVSKKPLHLLKEIQSIITFSDSAIGFPHLYTHGLSAKDKLVYAVIDLLGPNLEDLYNLCGR